MKVASTVLRRTAVGNNRRLSDFCLKHVITGKRQDATLFSKQNQENICQGTIDQFNKWGETLSSSVVEKKCYEEVKRIKNTIGSLSFNTKSSEVKNACDSWYTEIKKQNPYATYDQIWEVIEPQKATIAYKLTNSAQANCRKALQELYSNHALPSLESLISSFIQGDIKPLVAALLKREMKQIETDLIKLYPRDLPSDLMSALDGCHEAVLRITYPQVRSYFEKEKKSCDIIESGYSYIGLGKQKEPVDLEGKCFWVPASVCHQAPVGTSRHSFFVYGGVNINPRVNIVQNGNAPLRGNQVGGDSLNRANVTKWFQSHHIVSPTNMATKNHPLLKEAGFDNKRDINSQVNRIYLPIKREYNPGTEERPGRSTHNGKHTQMAMNIVARKMDTILEIGKSQNWNPTQYRSEFRAMVVDIRQELRTGKTDLYVKPTPK